VKASSQEAAFAIRRQLRSELDTVLQPVFEQAFEMLGAGDDMVRIPRLSLELKLRSGEDFVLALSEVLRDSLNEALHEAVIARPEQAGVQRVPSRASRRRTLMYYLASGQIEWHTRTGDAESIAHVLQAEADVLAGDGQAIAEIIGGSLLQRIAASFRLLQLLPGESRMRLLARSPLYAADVFPDNLSVTANTAVALLPTALQQLAGSGVLGSYQLLRVQALFLALRNEDIHYPLEAHINTLLHECLVRTPANAWTATMRTVLQALTTPEAETFAKARKRDIAFDAAKPNSVRPDLAARIAQPASDAPDDLPAADSAVGRSAKPAATSGDKSRAKLEAKSVPQSAAESCTKSDVEYPAKHDSKSDAGSGIRSAAKSDTASDSESETMPKAQLEIRSEAATAAAGSAKSNSDSKADSESGIAQNDVSDGIAKTIAPPLAFSSLASPDENGSYPTSDAGLVLLHPFIPRLFDAVGIAPAGTVELPEAMLPRAAALLHWLMSEREEVYEFELTTIKVLLGLPPDRMLLVGTGLLSEADKEEANALLAAAIAHWGALGKTGVAALRMSFLQRRGLLRDIGSGWQLRVEPESFDMLLGKLPWGISIVRLPWMTRPIFTEWPTP
jgi:hypothetical protein